MPDFRPGEINIVCTDLAASLRFYCDVLGFVEVEREDEAVRLRCEDRHYLLLPFASQPRSQQAYVAAPEFSFDLLVDDLESAAAYLEEQGVVFEKAYTLGARSVIIRDPDGLVIEVIDEFEFD